MMRGYKPMNSELLKPEPGNGHGPKYFVDVEGTEYPWPTDTISVGEMRRLANLPADQPLIEIDPDNVERTLAEDEVITLRPGHRFGKKVRYKRGLTDRVTTEIEHLRRSHPQAELHEFDGSMWVRIPNFQFPEPFIWNRTSDSLLFQIPVGFPGNPPYAFYVGRGIRLAASGAVPQNFEENATTPFTGDWSKFSWQDDGSWRPAADIFAGSNLASFVLTIADRLREAI
jgi:hypothetical protein